MEYSLEEEIECAYMNLRDCMIHLRDLGEDPFPASNGIHGKRYRVVMQSALKNSKPTWEVRK